MTLSGNLDARTLARAVGFNELLVVRVCEDEALRRRMMRMKMMTRNAVTADAKNS